jgi:hypothetical protein
MTVLIISDVHGNLLPPQSVFCARTGILTKSDSVAQPKDGNPTAAYAV